ncbi:hypothetical protein VUR80DRAFT_5308 [Thermomyces stellatus]
MDYIPQLTSGFYDFSLCLHVRIQPIYESAPDQTGSVSFDFLMTASRVTTGRRAPSHATRAWTVQTSGCCGGLTGWLSVLEREAHVRRTAPALRTASGGSLGAELSKEEGQVEAPVYGTGVLWARIEWLS